MKIKYIITKHETVRRTEKVQYVVSVPEKIKNKAEYAQKQLGEGNYLSCKVVDIIDSEMLDDEIIDFGKQTERNKKIGNNLGQNDSG